MSRPHELLVGPSPWSLTVPDSHWIEIRRELVAPPTAPASELTRAALEKPIGFEAMRRALTPDDRVTVVLDPTLPELGTILTEVFAHMASGGVQGESVTLLVSPGTGEDWQRRLPAEFADVRTEVHDPTDRKKLAYLASTGGGRRVYLNRTLVDGDFTIVVSGRDFDPLTGYAGAEAAVFPALADAEVLHSFEGQLSTAAPGESPWPIRAEAAETLWLLGTPFLVQVIRGESNTIQEVVAGLPDSSAEGVRRQNARWRGTVGEEVDTAVATISGDPAGVTFLDLAKAAACAARVVRKGGRIAVLTTAAPALGEGARLLRTMEEPTGARRLLAKEKPPDWAAALLWAFAAKNHSLFFASGYPDDIAEELFTTPIHNPAEVQRLIGSGQKVLLIPDANKTMLTVS